MTAPYSEAEAIETLKWLKRKKTAQTHNPEFVKLAIKELTDVIKNKKFQGSEQNTTLGNITLDLSESAKATIDYPKDRPHFSKEDYDIKSISEMNFESLQRTELIGQISPPLRTYLSIGGPRIPVPEGYTDAYTFPKGELGFGREIKNITEKGAHIIKGLPTNPFAGVPIGWHIEGSSSGTILAPDKDSIFEWGVDFERKDEEKCYTVSPGLDEIVQKEIKNCERFIPSLEEQAYWKGILPLPKIFKDAIETSPDEIPSIIAAWMRTRKYFCHNELGKMIRENADDLPILVRELKGGHCDLLSWETTALLRSYGIPAWTQTVRVPSLDGKQFENAYLHAISTYAKNGELQFIDPSALAEQDPAFHPKNLKAKEVQQFHEQYVQFTEDPEKRKALKEFREQREKKPNKHKGGYGLHSLRALLGSIDTSKDQEKRETKAVTIAEKREDELGEYIDIHEQLVDAYGVSRDPIHADELLSVNFKRIDRTAIERCMELSRKHHLDLAYYREVKEYLVDYDCSETPDFAKFQSWRFYFKNKTLEDLVKLIRSRDWNSFMTSPVDWPFAPVESTAKELRRGKEYFPEVWEVGGEIDDNTRSQHVGKDALSIILFADQMKQSWRQKKPTNPLLSLNVTIDYLTEQSLNTLGPFTSKKRPEQLAKHIPTKSNFLNNLFQVCNYKPSDVARFSQSFRRTLQRLDVKRLDRGTELDWGGFRPYVTGDDSHLIDQNIYARTGELVIKTYKTQKGISSPIHVIFGKRANMSEEIDLIYLPKLFFILKELEAETRKTGREVYVTAPNESFFYKLTPGMDVFRFWSGITSRGYLNSGIISRDENINSYSTQRGTLPKNVIYISNSDFSCAAASHHFRGSRIETICTLQDEYELHPLANPNWVKNGLPEERIFKKEE